MEVLRTYLDKSGMGGQLCCPQELQVGVTVAWKPSRDERRYDETTIPIAIPTINTSINGTFFGRRIALSTDKYIN